MSQVAHTCAWLLGCLAQSWGGAHQFRVPSATTLSGIRSLSRGSHAASTLASNWSEESSVQGPTDETLARGSSESPCRAVRLVNFPRDGHAPGVCATGSDVFPPRSSGTARSGHKKEMCCCWHNKRSTWILSACSLPGGRTHSRCATA